MSTFDAAATRLLDRLIAHYDSNNLDCIKALTTATRLVVVAREGWESLDTSQHNNDLLGGSHD